MTAPLVEGRNWRPTAVDRAARPSSPRPRNPYGRRKGWAAAAVGRALFAQRPPSPPRPWPLRDERSRPIGGRNTSSVPDAAPSPPKRHGLPRKSRPEHACARHAATRTPVRARRGDPHRWVRIAGGRHRIALSGSRPSHLCVRVFSCVCVCVLFARRHTRRRSGRAQHLLLGHPRARARSTTTTTTAAAAATCLSAAHTGSVVVLLSVL